MNPRTADFSTLFEALPIGAYRSSPDGTMLRANAALVRLNGYDTEAELLGAVRDIAVEWYVDPDRRAEFKRRLETEDRVVAFVSEVFRHHTRERIWISENARLVRDSQGRPLYYEGTVEEITERVRTEQALQRSEERLKQLVALIPGAVFRAAIDADGSYRYSFMSEGVRALYGVSPEEALRDGTALTRRRHPEDPTDLTERERAVNERRARNVDIRVRLDDGTEKWVQVISAPAPSEGDHGARVGVLFDVTERKQAEALRGERDRAAAADLAKTQFLSRVSHELRTPLNAVLGFGQLLEMEPGGGERQLGWTRQLLASGRHLLALMDDILDLSGIQSGELTLQTERVALAGVVRECISMLATMASEAGVTLHDELANDPALAARADRRRLQQVLGNLVSNAIKYNRRGGWVRMTAQAGDGSVDLAVADSGIGLDAGQMARLFRPFERVGAQHGPVPGTGLGLALSQQLAQAMGGTIEVASRPGEGSVFRLRLPSA